MKSLKKILFISPQPIFGGAATANMAIAKMLSGNGYSVKYNDEYASFSTYSGLVIDKTPIHNTKSRNKHLLKMIEDGQYDTIIWGDVSILLYYLPTLRKLYYKGVTQIGIFHSLCLERNVKSYIIEHCIAFAIRYFQKYVFVSEFTLQSWCKYKSIRKESRKLTVIHNPMEDPGNYNCRNFNPSTVNIGYVGRFSEEKQPEVFCALSKVSKYNFIAFGDGPLLPSMREIYPNVNFRGECKNTNEIYSNFDILVMTSKFENCPMVILEAKVRGIPCIAPHVGGIPEILENEVDGILYDNPSSIPDAIDTIVGNYYNFSENCKKRSKLTLPSSLIDKWTCIL